MSQQRPQQLTRREKQMLCALVFASVCFGFHFFDYKDTNRALNPKGKELLRTEMGTNWKFKDAKDSSLAVDGNKKSKCSISDRWWRVFLLYAYYVEKVVVYFDVNHKKHLDGAHVYIDNIFCQQIKIPIVSEIGPAIVHCPQIYGSEVTIKLEQSGTLGLCEVEVYGYPGWRAIRNDMFKNAVQLTTLTSFLWIVFGGFVCWKLLQINNTGRLNPHSQHENRLEKVEETPSEEPPSYSDTILDERAADHDIMEGVNELEARMKRCFSSSRITFRKSRNRRSFSFG